MDVLVGVALGLLGLWAALLPGLFLIRPRGNAPALAIRLLPDVLRLVARLARDPESPHLAGRPGRGAQADQDLIPVEG
ncbi:hypothetical protein F4560_007652 [Saccharothrix ecbatanensis]|uniref:Uncharacterized protein n=1 Tax=Saccharothrix ecbatanensis TaxID=1105145 RepID=A0A7W9M5D8_9PSEU|nr:hypothetical protein [Saccharothrix ecbatanensis]MBB5807884.1 hypothetical protein [Saccharothrix ecbatanensis]